MIIYTTREQVAETPLGKLVTTAVDRFDDPEWATERMTLLRYGYAQTAYALFAEEIERQFGKKKLSEFPSSVWLREETATFLLLIRHVLRKIAPVRAFEFTTSVAEDDCWDDVAEQWKANPAFQEKIQHVIHLLEECMSYFNMQYILWLVRHGYQRLPEFDEEPTTLFEGITYETLREFHGPIEDFGYGRGKAHYGAFTQVYWETIVQDTEAPELLRSMFSYTPDEIEAGAFSRTQGYLPKGWREPEKVLIQQIPAPVGYEQTASGLFVPQGIQKGP